MMLLVDNNDSYTYNLAHLLAEVAGEEPIVVPAAAFTDPAAPGSKLLDRVRAGEFSHILISPGPGSPDREADFAGSRAVIEAARDTPLLGVCLGHQGLAVLAGARVTRAAEARHGFVSTITHSGEGLFAGIPQGFEVVRYHSLHIGETPGITVHARSEDGVIQALKVDGRPHWGVQFHPESILTQYGRELMGNFVALGGALGGGDRLGGEQTAPWRLTHEQLDYEIDCQRVFNAIRAADVGHGSDGSERGGGCGNYAFWLDSADTAPSRGRYSILGDAHGELSRVIEYRIGDDPDIFSELEAELARGIDTGAGAVDLPFTGGFVGYLGYECAQLTLPGADLGRHKAETPDAVFVRPETWIVVDHHEHRTHVCTIGGAESLERLRRVMGGVDGEGGASIGKSSWRTQDYRDRIAQAQELLRAGESYEICLTDTLEVEADGELYAQLRRHNPAPYAAHLCFGGTEILSASPERFLTVRAGMVEAKPIKGTIAAGEDPAKLHDAKTRAENLMIVDLLRNDLARVCHPGTVKVPSLMAVEKYATVQQLVSTVTGGLRTGLVELLRAAFPPGSMTGAPKLRTCEIIDRLETGPRGVYSGALGYLGFDGQADLSVVIRTAVRTGSRVTVGAGGAIVLASDPDAEVAEVELKAEAVLGAW